MHQAKTALKKTLAHCAHTAGILRRKLSGKCLILAYHRVLPSLSASDAMNIEIEPELIVSIQALEQNLIFLHRHFRIISLTECFERLAQQSLRPDVAYAAVTFDDGWLDNYQYAWPILKSLDIPVTVFLATGFIGSQKAFWWEALGRALLTLSGASQIKQAQQLIASCSGPELPGCFFSIPAKKKIKMLKQLLGQFKTLQPAVLDRLSEQLAHLAECGIPVQTMNWNQVQEMSKAGVDFGAHTVNHTILDRLEPELARFEIEASWHQLSDHVQNPVPIFCYPNGNVNDTVAGLVKSSGFYQGAVTITSGLATHDVTDFFRVPRVNIPCHASQSMGLFKSRLLRA